MSANAQTIKWEAHVCTPNTGQVWATDNNPTQLCAPGVVCVPERWPPPGPWTKP